MITCNCSDNQLRSLEKKTKFKLHVSNYQIIHLPQHNWVPINTLTTPLNSWKLQSTKAPKYNLKTPIFFKKTEFLQDKPRMQHESIPKGLENPNLREEYNPLPESVVSRKKGLKRKVIPAENPSKSIFGKLRGWRRDR